MALEQTIPEKEQQPRILIVDDDQDTLALLAAWLDNTGFQTVSANSGQAALAQLSLVQPHLVITDLVMEGMDGMTLMAEIHRQNPLKPVIMLSGRAKIPDAVKATQLGSLAVLTKPINKDELIEQVKKVLHLTHSGDRQEAVLGRHIVYRSTVMGELLEHARLVADSDITVFINGHTGTGKEVLAKAIHEASPRREKPFIGVNCGAIPEQLLESELFGHEKGAFTGAVTRREGLFQAADGGTLFLDEIGDMPLSLQVKLLRVLQDFEVRPVGAVRSKPVNVRIVSATHNDLEEAVKAGEFREDLYYRLHVVPLTMPSLAERREDIPLLLDHFLRAHARRRDLKRKHLAPDTLEYLTAAPWPGNVRQLVNVVEQCAALSKGQIIPLAMAKKALRDEPGQLQTLKEATHALERKYLITVLRLANGNVANAARMAGRNRTELYKLLSQHQLTPSDFRTLDKAED